MAVPEEFKGMERSISTQIRRKLDNLRQFGNRAEATESIVKVALRGLVRHLPDYAASEKDINMLTLCVGDQAANAFIENIEDAFAIMRMRAYVAGIIADEDRNEDSL